MHVSVTALGATTSAAARAARNIVDYLSGRSHQPPARTHTPTTDAKPAVAPGGGGAGRYYADSATAPGRWIGSGVDTLLGPDARQAVGVDPLALERVLLGQHPRTGEQLVGAKGSAGRVERDEPEPTPIAAAARARPDELLSVAEVAHAVGVDESYIRRLLRRTDQHLTATQPVGGGEQSGTPDAYSPPSGTYLRGTKVGQGWQVTRAETQRFIDTRSEPRVVMGYDLTFSVAKSVSVAWAAAGPDGRAVIEAALHQAVDRSLSYVEDHGIKVRVGRTQTPGEGMVAAAFLHDTSRELEPQLHVHVVVANMGTTPAGKIQALDGRGLFAHGTTAGYLAETEIQNILTDHGYRFTATENGIAHLEVIPDAAVEAFSTRRSQILDEVGALGADSPLARQRAAWNTRTPKPSGTDRAQLETAWTQTLHRTGMTPDVLAAATSHAPLVMWTPADTKRLDRFLTSPNGVARASGIFDRRDVIQVITDRVGGRLDATAVQAHADRWLATDAVIPLRAGPDQLTPGTTATGIGLGVNLVPSLIRYTTPQVIETETIIANAYHNSLDLGAGVVDPAVVTRAITTWEQHAGHTLGADQVAMIRAITTSGHRVQGVVGPAGSGKTAALDVAAQAWTTAGYDVIGASVNGTAAEVLANATGIDTRTVASLLERLRYDHTRQGDPTAVAPLLNEQTVVVVDEASTLSNRDHAELIQHVTRADATLRTVGDPAQHSAVEAGHAWAAAMAANPNTTPALSENRRMTGPAMEPVRQAAHDYRHGHIAAAIGRLEDDNRLVTAATPSEVLDTLAADWYQDWQAHLNHPDTIAPSRMLAENHTVRRELNERAQHLLRADHHINPNGTRIGEATFHIGDHVIARQQNRDLHPGNPHHYLRNGTRGIVTAIDTTNPAQPNLVVDFDDRGPITVNHEFLTQRLRPGVTGGLAPAYAMTTHAAQGDTYHTSRAVLTDRSTTPGTYVALTRGRNNLRFYTLDATDLAPPTPAAEHNLPTTPQRQTLEERIETRLQQPTPTQLATLADPDLTIVNALRHLPIRHLEDSPHPTANRVAAMKLGQARQRALTNPPPHLTAIIGYQPDTGPWRRTVTLWSHYTQRWETDPLAHPAGESLAGANDDAVRRQEEHPRFTDALIDARATHLGPLTPAEIADAWQRLDTPTPVDDVGQRLERQRTIEAAALTHADLAYRYALTPRNGYIDANIAESRRRALDRARHDLARTNAEIDDHQTLTNPASPSASGRDAVYRVAVERRALQRITHRHASATLAAPPPYLTRLLGSRPPPITGSHANTAARRRWDQTARAIETYRITHLGLGPHHGTGVTNSTALHQAIGTRPTQPRAVKAWDKLQQLTTDQAATRADRSRTAVRAR